MATDYKNISKFETAVVMMIVVGMVLIAGQIYLSLPDQTQAQLASAMQVFDASNHVAIPVQTVQVVIGGMHDFQQQVYVVSAQLFDMPDFKVQQNFAAVKSAYQKVAATFTQLSDSLASNYQSNQIAKTRTVDSGYQGGQVLGAFIEKFVK